MAHKITRKSFLKVFAATVVGGASASVLAGESAPVNIDETNGKVSRWVKNTLNPDGPLTTSTTGWKAGDWHNAGRRACICSAMDS